MALINMTIGKSYIIIGEEEYYNDEKIYYIENDKGVIEWHFASRFISLKEYRRNKLEKINEIVKWK